MAASVNLSKMNLEQLTAHKAEVEQLIATYEIKQTESIVNTATQAAIKAAKEAGATPEQIAQLEISLNAPKRRGRPAATKAKSSQESEKRSYPAVKAKYAHPENTSLTWSGRGRTPKWVSDYEAKKGNKLKDLEIA